MGNNQNKYTNEEFDSKKSYYNLLSKNFKQRCDNNHFNLFNINYAFFQKDFERNYINQHINISNELSFIPWKIYLVHVLKHLAEEKSYLWAHSLKEIIINENFPEQSKFQNIFFYQEHQILSSGHLDVNNDFNFEEFGYTYNYRDKDYLNNIEDPLMEQAPNSDPFTLMKNKISNNLMTSFISMDSNISLNSSKKIDPNVEYNFNKSKIKKYMSIFKQHLSIKEHPINFVLLQFITEFIPYVNDVIDFYKKNMEDNAISCEEKAEDIIKQLQEFIALMQVTIKLFYAKAISYIYFKDEKDEFINLVSYLIFNNSKLYKVFFQLFELKNKKNEKLLEEKIIKFGDMKPEEFAIKPKFCLNQKTREFMEQLKEEERKKELIENDEDSEDKNTKEKDKESNKLTFNINGEEKIIIDEEEITTKEKEANNKSGLKDSNNSSANNNNENNENNENKENNDNNDNNDNNQTHFTEDNFKISRGNGNLNIFTKDFFENNSEYDPNTPYCKAILYLKKIVDFKEPLGKLIIVSAVSNIITECVNNFWENMQYIIKPEMLSIDADELMTIFIYIIYKCKMPSLFIHSDFIKYFTTPMTKSAMIGYYYTTLQGCLEFILDCQSKSDFLKDGNQ